MSDQEVCGRAGVRVEQNLIVGVAELLQDLTPTALAHAKGLVELAERGDLLGGEETDAAPEGVAHENR